MRNTSMNLLIWLTTIIECAGDARSLLFDFIISPPIPTEKHLNLKLFEPIRMELEFGSTTDLLVQDLAKEAKKIWSNALKVYPGEFDFPSTCDRVVNPTTPSFDHLLFVTSDDNCQVPVQGRACASHPVTGRPVGGVLHFCTSVLKKSDLQLTVRELGYLLGLDPQLWSSWHPSHKSQWKMVKRDCDDLPDIVLQGNLVTPLALQVVANHLDCQEIEGIPLEKSIMCLGDPKLLWNENSIYPTPLALAMFEDSAWYTADYGFAETQAEGLGRGCDYLEEETNDNNYCQGEACEKTMCDATHFQVVECHDENNCEVIVDCMKEEQIVSFTRQMQSTEQQLSRCFDTNWGHGICLETECDTVRQVALVDVQGQQYECSRENEYHLFSDEDILGFQCPPFELLCPDLICPANCAGRGICKQDGCTCFDSLTDSPMCTQGADDLKVKTIAPQSDGTIFINSSGGKNNFMTSMGFLILGCSCIFLW